mgnify:CR=1 FL=1
MVLARLSTFSSADRPSQMGGPPAQLCESGTPIPPLHRTHSSIHLPGLTNQTIATATARPEENPALLPPPRATPLAHRRTPDEALADRCAHTRTALNPLLASPPSARQPETLLDLERYLARSHPHGTTALALSPAALRSVDTAGYKYRTFPRQNPVQQRQPNYGREEREVGLELCVTGCYYGGTSHEKAQRRTRPDTATRGDTRDSERELASELPRTDEQQHYKQEDEGPDRPSPPHQDNG